MLRLWHNPRCSKSRAALKLLEESGAAVEIYRYLETPPSDVELSAVLAKLDIAAVDLARRGEAAWKESGLAKNSPDDAVRAAMLDHPILIERPILEADDRAVVGRPPEAVLDLL